MTTVPGRSRALSGKIEVPAEGQAGVMSNTRIFRSFKSSPEIIRPTVMMYVVRCCRCGTSRTSCMGTVRQK